MFQSLTRADLGRIVDIQMQHLARLLEDRGIGIELTAAAQNALADEGYDPAYGARPLKRTIQRRIQDPLAMRILQGEFREGDTVVVDYQNNDYRFDQLRQVSAAA